MTQTSSAAPRPAPLSSARRMTIYVAVMAGMFMAALDMQIIATALPTIAGKLGDIELFGWVGAAYLLATAAVTPFYGKLGDLFGRKRVFLVAIVLFTLGSLACGLAWSMPSLIGARILQGLGGGGLMTSAFAIMADLFEARERAKYQGYSSAVFTLAGLIGPVAGGWLAQAFGWEWIFLINLPIGIIVIVAVSLAMPSVYAARSHRIDYAGGLLLAATVTMTVYWAEEVLAGRAPGPLAYVLPVMAVAALIAFVIVERRAEEPVLPPRLFADSTIRLVLLISVVHGMCTLGLFNYFALFIQTMTGLPPAQAGALFLPSSVGSLMASIFAGSVVARTGRYKYFPVAGMLFGLVATAGFAFLTPTTPYWMIGVLMFVFSMTLGLQMQTLMIALQVAAPPRDVGAATGAISLARTVGASLGLAVNGGVLHAGLIAAQNALPADVAAALPAPLTALAPEAVHALPPALFGPVLSGFSGAFSGMLYFCVGLFGLGFLLTLMLKDIRIPNHGRSAEPQARPVPQE